MKDFLREVFIRIYLILFKIIFNTFKVFGVSRRKSVFISSFGDNHEAIITELSQLKDEQIIVLRTWGCRGDFSSFPNVIALTFSLKHPVAYCKGIFHLATAAHIFVDNYFGFLAVTSFHKDVRCIQLWHAAGAVKQFGLMDRSNITRTNAAMKRFRKVYNRFTDIVIGSERMAEIFKEAFGYTDDTRFIRTGIPRTDFFFNEQRIQETRMALFKKYPLIQGKKTILYAPTYRDDQLTNAEIALDIKLLSRALSDEYVLLLKLHPAVANELPVTYGHFVLDISNELHINHLLTITDVLITDYSSVPFEYALLNKPMVFYAYDVEDYALERGLWEDFDTFAPGIVARTSEEVVGAIEAGTFDVDKVHPFSERWNTYNQGSSSQALLNALGKPVNARVRFKSQK